MTSPQSRDFPARVFLKLNVKMTGDFRVLNSAIAVQLVDLEHLMHFQSETSVFKFPQRSVEEKRRLSFGA